MRFLFLIACSLLSVLVTSQSSYAQIKKNQPDYAGHISYTQGNFGTFGYPQLKDSVIIFLKDSTGIECSIFDPSNKKIKRTLFLDFAKLEMVNRKEYNNIVAIDKMEKTGNYDLKLTYTPTGMHDDTSIYDVYLGHYGDGSYAQLAIISESDNLRVYDMLVADIVRLKR